MCYARLFLAIGLIAGFFATSAAVADSRFTPPPRAVVLSGDLTSPFLLQFHNRLTRQRGYRQKRRLGWRAPAHRPRGVQRQQLPYARPAIRPAGFNRRLPAATQPARPAVREIDPKYLPQRVRYETRHKPGTIIVDTAHRFLYLIEANGMARRYGVGVGKDGFRWSGSHKITRRAEWPDWRPPGQMIERERRKGRELPRLVRGGPANPLGARALYIGSTLYRIHGTNQPWTIGGAVSSGCIRMRNEDVIDLYERVSVGAKVVVS